MPFTQVELEERRRFLGASEAAAAIGLSSFFTPLQLYKAKIGEGEQVEETLPMMVGTALEPVVLDFFEKETGLKVTDRQLKVVDQAIPWRRATLDGIASDGAVVQAKSSGQWGLWGKEDDAVPQSIVYQVHHEMACLGSHRAYVPVILGQRTFKVYTVDRDEELIELLTAGEIQFMQRVDERRPPDPKDLEDVKLLYPVDFGTTIRATPEIEAAGRKLAELKGQAKIISEACDELTLAVKSFMGTNTTLLGLDGKPLYTHASHTQNTIDVTRLRSERPDIADAYGRETVVRTLRRKFK